MTLACKTIEFYENATGAMPMLFSIRDCIPLAFPALITTIFFILFASQYFIIMNKTRKTTTLISLTASSFVTTILSMFLLLTTLVTYKFVLFWAFVTMASFIALMLSDDR